MNRDRLLQERDIEVLRRYAVVLHAEVEALYKKLAELRAEFARAEGLKQVEIGLVVTQLTEELASRNAELFGSSRSERRGRPKGASPEGAPPGEESSSKPKEPKKKKPGHGPTPQPNLPVKVKEHTLDEADQLCPHCDSPTERKPELDQESEQISVEFRTYFVLKNRQAVYGCRPCGHLQMAPMPNMFFPGGRYTEEFAAHVVVDKFADHLPLERQVERMRRAGLDVTSQTLWDQEKRLADLLLPTGEAHHRWMLETHDVLGADETRWRMMGKGHSKKWWAWSLSAPDGVYFDLLPSRGTSAAKVILKAFDGIVIADGYSVYASLEHDASNHPQAELKLVNGKEPEKLSDFLLACCWAHARRYFFDAEDNYPVVGTVLDLIAELYAVEAEAERRAKNGADLLQCRRELRDEKSRPIVEKIHTWLKEQHPPPGLQFDKAVNYSVNRWSALQVFLDHPEVPIDNTSTERAIRGPVLGRLNFQGVRSVAGARAAALFYSLIGTCRRQGIDPYAYLVYAARRAIDKPGTVTLPHEYKAVMAQKVADSLP